MVQALRRDQGFDRSWQGSIERRQQVGLVEVEGWWCQARGRFGLQEEELGERGFGFGRRMALELGLVMVMVTMEFPVLVNFVCASSSRSCEWSSWVA
jgi:hypothetical protein